MSNQELSDQIKELERQNVTFLDLIKSDKEAIKDWRNFISMNKRRIEQLKKQLK